MEIHFLNKQKFVKLGDGSVGVADLLAVIDQWGGSGSADVNGDGVVNVTDLLAIVGAWGPCL